jgi:hypothetical protein
MNLTAREPGGSFSGHRKPTIFSGYDMKGTENVTKADHLNTGRLLPNFLNFVFDWPPGSSEVDLMSVLM